jgi:NADPH-dependent 2,4-dienoyl-CoA reductase/sulfur reductase-like enzyme/nitrite reductase/ring-hydroxylating ferredoxin subunit
MSGSHDAGAVRNLKNGVPLGDLPDGSMVAGRVDGNDVLLARRGEELFAVGAHCTHYHGPLAEGVIVGDTVRCPWHHACFSLQTGEALRAPALDPIACWRVERVGDLVFVREKRAAPAPRRLRESTEIPVSVVIVGGGGAGLAAAETLRREGYDGPVTIISRDDSAPYDRPNLSKDFLAGTAQEDWIPLRSPKFYTEQHIDLVLDARVSRLDVGLRRVVLDNGKSYEFGKLLIATGAEPVTLTMPGAAAIPIHYLRTFSDARAIVASVSSATRVVVVGASFIGLEVAASLRTRGVAVDVVAPDREPLERVMGPKIGRFIRTLHEEHGVMFHLGQTVSALEGRVVTLTDATKVDADAVVVGVGVRPAIAIADDAGLVIDRGIVVNEYLETSAAGIFAAGDVARWPDPYTGDRIRVEHWVVAERQGQVAAKNMLGLRERYAAIPFFWSQHYDVAINYVGHAERWDAVDIDGRLEARDCTVTYKRGGRAIAGATIGRDRASLAAELKMERETAFQPRQGAESLD